MHALKRLGSPGTRLAIYVIGDVCFGSMRTLNFTNVFFCIHRTEGEGITAGRLYGVTAFKVRGFLSKFDVLPY